MSDEKTARVLSIFFLGGGLLVMGLSLVGLNMFLEGSIMALLGMGFSIMSDLEKLKTKVSLLSDDKPENG